VQTDKLKRLEDLRTELSLALGEAIWAFSMIEGLTYDYLKELHIQMPGKTGVVPGFKSRVDPIMTSLELLEGQDEEKARALRYWSKALKLAHRRNEIAHNPWGIWISFDTQEFRTELWSHKDREEKIDLPAVIRFRNDAREVASNLHHSLITLEFLAKAGDSETAL
jgi:hypothetical protein